MTDPAVAVPPVATPTTTPAPVEAPATSVVEEVNTQASMHLQSEVARIAMALTQALAQMQPPLTDKSTPIVVMALLNMAASMSQGTSATKEQLWGFFVNAYDRTHAAMQNPETLANIMQMLGLKPGDPPPADLQERLAALRVKMQAGG